MALLKVFLLVAAFASLLASPALSDGLTATLTHVDSGKKLTQNEFFQRALQRTMAKVQARLSKQNPSGIGRVLSGEYGEFAMNMTIGTPPMTYLAIIDSDTDLIWTLCKPMRCLTRYTKCDTPTRYDPRKSSTYVKLPCGSQSCKLSANTSCNTKEDSCMFTYEILSDAPTSWAKGNLATETFRGYNGENSVGNLTFGCTHATSEDLGGVDSGFVGLGRGFPSLTSQMKAEKFSHCFPSYDDQNATGVIAFGAQVKKVPQSAKQAVVTTNLIKNLHQPSAYYVSLKGIKVNGTALALNPSAFQIMPDGQGGTAMDSGMAVSYLEESIYKILDEKVKSLVRLKSASGQEVGLDTCFVLPRGLDEKGYNKLFPSISFIFANGNRQGDLLFPIGNVFRSYYDEVHGEITCLAMRPAPRSDGRTSIGNMQLQQTLVVYDLAANKVSFVPKLDCGKM